MVRGACWPGSTHGLPNIGFVTFVMVWMVAIWVLFDPQWKINRNLQVFKRFPKKKKIKSRKTKKMEKNGLKKSVKLRKKKRSDWKLLFKSNCVKKTYPFESVQKAFEKRSKSVRKPFETVRHYAKCYVKWKTFQDPNKPCRPQSHLDHSGKTWFKTLTLFRFTIRSWRAGKDFTAVRCLSLGFFSAMQHSLVTCLESYRLLEVTP